MSARDRSSGRARAVTLIEAVLFISIALGLIVGGLVFFQQASLAQRTSATIRLVSAIVSEGRVLFENTDVSNLPPDGIENLAPILIAAGAVPSSAVAGTELRSPWGARIEAEARDVTSVAPDYADRDVLRIVLHDIDPRICARLAPFDPDSNGVLGTDITGVTIGDPAVGESYAAFSAAFVGESGLQVGITAAQAGEECGQRAQDDGGAVDQLIIWYAWK